MKQKQIVKYFNKSKFCSTTYTANGSTTRSLVESAVCCLGSKYLTTIKLM